MIIGESHYAKTEVSRTYEEVLKDRGSDLYYTRKIVYEAKPLLGNCDWSTPTLNNIPRIIFGSDNYDRQAFWSNAVYANIVQRLMCYDWREQASYNDFLDGWKTLINLFDLLRPTHVIMLGSRSRMAFPQAAKELIVQHSGISRIEKRGRSYSYGVNVKGMNFSTQIVFLPHPGTYFSHSRWHDFLSTYFSSLITNLKTEYT